MLVSFASIYHRRHNFNKVDYNKPVPILSTSQSEFEGRKVSSSAFTIDNPKDRYKGLSAVDFSLENQQLVGFNPKPCFYSRSSSEIDFMLDKFVSSKSLKDGK